jgi:Dolichyl-phosphate-mannose-protein mannosyltransferase
LHKRAGHRMNKPNSLTSGARTYLFAYAVIFTFLFVTHAFLLRLPYFWDEAGYYIPAARDLLLTGSPIPHTTLSNAHPPLVMFWLAFWWKFSGFTPTTTREAMLMVSAFALLGLWRMARNVTTESVAAATVLCTSLYPVFFCQSSMAHLDMMAAAFTLWGLAMYVEGRTVATIIFFSLAALSKETAIVTPMVLLTWELLRPVLTRSRARRESWFLYHSPRHALSFLICLLPLIGWFIFHHHRTGFYLGNPYYLRYNLQATLNPLRIVLALLIRLWHVFGYLNLFLLVLGAAAAMTQAPLRESDSSERPRIAINVQLAFLVVLAANVIAESVLGGAVLARYMLPVIPLVVLVCISTMRRRLRQWTWFVAIVAMAFVVQLFVPAPYRVAPEDTLLYRDYVLLHKQAADELAKHPQRTVLTAWPASDELTRPYLGYVKQALPVIRIENFSASEIERAAHATDQFDVVYLFSTKWEPPHPLLERLTFGKALQARFFDYHEDLKPQAAAGILGGRITDYQNRNNEWIGLITIEKVEDARTTAQPFKAAALNP